MNRHLPVMVPAACAAAIAVAAMFVLHMAPEARRMSPGAAKAQPVSRTPVSSGDRPPADESACVHAWLDETQDGSLQPDAAADAAHDGEALEARAAGDDPAIQWADSYTILLRRARAIEADAAEREAEMDRFRATPLASLPQGDLEYLVGVVEAQARARLARLSAAYRLSEEQRERVYRVLVPAMPSYHPELVVAQPATPSGTARMTEDATPARGPEPATSSDAEAQVYAVLDDTQKADFENDWVDRDLWWSEIIGQLSDDLDRELAAAVEAAPAADGLPEDVEPAAPEEHLEGNLLDLLHR